ncbi:hypothetical protein VNO78_17804 [Psophocarpus tetragonolobus]|uniref:Uncharacterized protein n=1 Tax=Psophocarpus tetragonolobus TaxID=3891 RepID=A0AAN9SJF4_PSOTE
MNWSWTTIHVTCSKRALVMETTFGMCLSCRNDSGLGFTLEPAMDNDSWIRLGFIGEPTMDENSCHTFGTCLSCGNGSGLGFTTEQTMDDNNGLGMFRTDIWNVP